MKKLHFLQNKTFIKWVKYNCLTIVIGVSIILNIIYLPKYFSAQNKSSQNVTTITIQVKDSTVKKNDNIIFSRKTYVTTFKTLGILLNACPNKFHVEKFASMNLRYLFGVIDDSGKEIKQNDKYWWKVEKSLDGKSFVQTPMGIDDTFLTNNDHFQFELTPIS